MKSIEASFFLYLISLFLQENEKEREENEDDAAGGTEHWEDQDDAVEEDLGIDIHPAPIKKN